MFQLKITQRFADHHNPKRAISIDLFPKMNGCLGYWLKNVDNVRLWAQAVR